jgi:2-oxoglutarate ferredoxin oxidoreductase subunit alpha
LPTRTEQGDLNLALYAGHGEFPRIIYAPGDLPQGIDLAHRAFNMADKYQVPVFILTDQYFLDSSYDIATVDHASLREEHRIVKTSADYKRYRMTDSGISPRGVPGWGDGTVCADSDEHTEGGYITEDFSVRTSMVDKRLRKLARIQEDAVPPSLIGSPDYRILLVGWGSTYTMAREALWIAGVDGVSFLHFSQLYPLPARCTDHLAKAKKLVMVENNATGQFGRLIEATTGLKFDAWVLKYDGQQFTVEDIVKAISDAGRS